MRRDVIVPNAPSEGGYMKGIHTKKIQTRNIFSLSLVFILLVVVLGSMFDKHVPGEVLTVLTSLLSATASYIYDMSKNPKDSEAGEAHVDESE